MTTTITAATVRSFDATAWETHLAVDTIDWSEFSAAAVRSVRELAARNGDNDLAALCTAELITRGEEDAPHLCDYQTGDYLRDATAEERAASVEAARHDGGAGVIEVDGRSCYVVD